MEWRRRPGSDPADPHGVADLLARACDTVSSTAVEGTRFLFTTREMLRVSREIEQDAMVSDTGRLHVGVQHGYRLDAQADVYGMLSGGGVDVCAYGMDGGPDRVPVDWVQVDEDPSALEASWFLVHQGEHPRALVGFELSRGADGRRRWEGFESRDTQLVAGILAHLERIASRVGSSSRRTS